MSRVAKQEWIDFSSPMAPASAIDKHPKVSSTRHAKTVLQWPRPYSLFRKWEVLRSSKLGFRKRVVLSLRRHPLKRHKALSFLQLLIELAITVVVAGILVPSLLRSGPAAKQALVGDSLRAINLAGVRFSYSYKDIGFAILGVLAGAAAALALASPARRSENENLQGPSCHSRGVPLNRRSMSTGIDPFTPAIRRPEPDKAARER